MPLVVEDFRPYERSGVWRLHDAYFALSGAGAWTRKEIPYVATSSYAMARQHARVLVTLVADLVDSGALRPDDEVRVLEVGSGLGRFAGHLFRALEVDCGPAGVALRPRLRYLLSDYAARTVREAIALSPLAELHAAGQIVPALFDICRPGELVDLQGAPVTGPITAAFANYVCCALPPKVLRKTPDGLLEKLARVALDPPANADAASASQLWQQLLDDPTRPGLMNGVQLTFGWGSVELASVFSDARDRAAFEELTAPFAEATVVYPIRFLEFARALASRMGPGGALFVTDFGSARARDVEGAREAKPTCYGNSLCHGVNFAVFDAFCRHSGLGLVRTRDPLLALHRAAIRYGQPITPRLATAFRKAHVADDRGERAVDLRTAAGIEYKAGDHKSAARLYRRCLGLDPYDPELYLRIGEACFDGGFERLALRYLRRGKQVDVARLVDFDFLLGRVYFKLGRYPRARRAFRRALVRERHPATYANLGMTYERLEEPRRAIRCYQRALGMAPEGDTADTVRRKLCDIYLRVP
jgi:tetratricopeptide (TPR) repeat protein